MALVLLCGLPVSGKSATADRIAALVKEQGREVHIVRDGEDGIGSPLTSDDAKRPTGRADATRAVMYADSAAEKKTRARLRAATERAITGSRVVICDSLNYIKGFRYEMYCVAKTSGVRYCVVYCEHDAADAVRRDTERGERGDDAYGEVTCTALTKRFEQPSERHRWDSPLYRVNVFEDVWRDSIASVADFAISRGSKLEPTMATRVPERQGADVLGTVDRLTREAEAAIIYELQRGKARGERILVPDATKQVCLERKPRVAELRNMRRSYLSLARVHPPQGKNHSAMLDEYVEFVNAQLRVMR